MLLSEISNPNDDTVLYFMYTYTAYLIILPITRYMYAHATLEELIEETGRTAGELGAQLTILEISGRIERRAGRAFALARGR